MMLAAAPPVMVPILNVVLPNRGWDGQSTCNSAWIQLIKCSMAETPRSG